MFSRTIIIALAFCLIFGCIHPRKVKMAAVTPIVPPHQQFIANNIDWKSIRRIVLMPPANQTAYPAIDRQFQVNLAAEIQRVGRFEIVVATYDDPGARAEDVFASGQFNEMEVLRVAREYQADAVLFANVTQYHPYAPPKVGASLLLVSPAESIAIASIDGLWDAREINTAKMAQAYFQQTQNWSRSLMGADRVIDSPDVFQRFVCQQIATSLYPSVSGAAGPSGVTMPQPGMPPPAGMMPSAGMMPAGGMMPFDPAMSNGAEIPPMPPPAPSE